MRTLLQGKNIKFNERKDYSFLFKISVLNQKLEQNMIAAFIELTVILQPF